MGKIVGWASAQNDNQTVENESEMSQENDANTEADMCDEQARPTEETVTECQENVGSAAGSIADKTITTSIDVLDQQPSSIELPSGSDTQPRIQKPPIEEQSPLFDHALITIKELPLFYKNVPATLVSAGCEYLDISFGDLHQAEFLVKHAERFENVNHFELIKAAFEVKRRHDNSEYSDFPDNLLSPNLDALITFLEERYEAQFDSVNNEE